MTTTNSSEFANFAAAPRVTLDPGKWYGKLRVFEATVPLASQASGDIVNLFSLPKGFRPLFGMLNSDTSLGSATAAIGIAGTTGKYRAAATFTATGTPTLFGVTAAVNGDALAADETAILTIGAAALPASGTLKVLILGTGQE